MEGGIEGGREGGRNGAREGGEGGIEGGRDGGWDHPKQDGLGSLKYLPSIVTVSPSGVNAVVSAT